MKKIIEKHIINIAYRSPDIDAGDINLMKTGKLSALMVILS